MAIWTPPVHPPPPIVDPEFIDPRDIFPREPFPRRRSGAPRWGSPDVDRMRRGRAWENFASRFKDTEQADGRFTPRRRLDVRDIAALKERLRSAREDRQGGRVSESERRQRAQEQTRMAQNMRNRQGPRMYAADWMQEIADKVKQQNRLEDRKGAPNRANIPSWTPEEQATAAHYMANRGQYRNVFGLDPIQRHAEQSITGVQPYLATPVPPEYPISHYMVENPDFGWDDVLKANPFSVINYGSPEWPFQVVPTSEYDVNVGGMPIWPPQQWNRLAPDMWQYLRTGGFPIG